MAAPGSRCVRGGPLPATAFTVSASGDSVADSSTGLVWQRAAATDRAWLDALTYCNGLVLDGADDWRLPNYKELWTIVDMSRTAPAIDLAVFPGTPSLSFWTSSPVGDNRATVYVVDFIDGVPRFTGGLPTTNVYGVRCVRGGS